MKSLETVLVSFFRGDLYNPRQGFLLTFINSIEALKELGLDVTVLGFASETPDLDVRRDLVKFGGSRFSIKALRARGELYRRLLRYKPDIMYVHHSPDFPSSLLLRGRINILHAHDILGDVATLIFKGLGHFLRFYFSIDEALASKKTDLLLVPSDYMGRILKSRGFKRYRVAYNFRGFIEGRECELTEMIKSAKRPIFVYVGTIQNRIRGIEEISKFVELYDGTLILIGKKEGKIPKNALYHPAVDRSCLIGSISYADFGVLGKTLPYSLPSKIFDYINARLPIVISKHNKSIIEFLESINRPYILYDEKNDKTLKDVRDIKSLPDIKSCKEMVRDAVKELLAKYI